MKLRILKNKKGYNILILKHNQIIESFYTNKLDQFYLEHTKVKKIKQIEVTLDVTLMHKETFPIMSNKKILKIFNQNFNEINKDKECLIIKKIMNKKNSKIEYIYYYVQQDIKLFLTNNKLNHKVIRFYNENIIFNKKYQYLINIDDYGIIFTSDNVIKYHHSTNFKTFNNYENIIVSLLFVNVNIKKLYVLIKKELEQEYVNFIKYLFDNVEERVKVIVEKI